MNFITKFFCICAGANLKVLEECPTERTRFVGMGAAIFFTACLAVLSGTFAIQTISSSLYLSIAFGVFWGAMIFNLDRYIVSTIKKSGVLWKELLYIFPRFLFAILISFIITKPLEIELFRNQIEYQISQDDDVRDKQSIFNKLNKYGVDTLNSQKALLSQKKSNLRVEMAAKPSSYYFIELNNRYNSEKERLQVLDIQNKTAIKDKQTNINNLYNRYSIEKSGVTSTLNSYGLKQKNILNQEINSLKNEIVEKQKEIEQLETKIEIEKNKYNEAKQKELLELEQEEIRLTQLINQANSKAMADLKVTNQGIQYGTGLLAELEALESLKSKSSTVWWTSWLIVLLFTTLEISPLLVKVITKRGPYDEILEYYELEVLLRQKERIAALTAKTEQSIASLDISSNLSSNAINLDNNKKALLRTNKRDRKLAEKEIKNTKYTPFLVSDNEEVIEKQTSVLSDNEVIVKSDQSRRESIISDKYIQDSKDQNSATYSSIFLPMEEEVEILLFDPEQEKSSSIPQFAFTPNFSIQIPDNEQQNNQSEPVIDTFVDKLWKNKDNEIVESYYFKSGPEILKEVIYTIKEVENRGVWSYENNRQLVKILLNNDEKIYQVIEITSNLLRLREPGSNSKSAYFIC